MGPGQVLPCQEVTGLGPGLKFGVRSPNKRKSLGRSGTTIGKKWDIIQG